MAAPNEVPNGNAMNAKVGAKKILKMENVSSLFEKAYQLLKFILIFILDREKRYAD